MLKVSQDASLMLGVKESVRLHHLFKK